MSNTQNTLNVLEARLNNLAQKSTESMEENGKRASRLLRQFEAHYGLGLSKPLANKLNRDITKQFSTNTRVPKIRNALRLRGTEQSLEKCIQYSIEQESLIEKEEINLEVICAYCSRALVSYDNIKLLYYVNLTDYYQLRTNIRSYIQTIAKKCPADGPDKTCFITTMPLENRLHQLIHDDENCEWCGRFLHWSIGVVDAESEAKVTD